ncbi:MAG: FtsX-like permease family protein [Pseudobdellovibrio sp.]
MELFRFKKITSFLILNFSLGLVGFFLLQLFQQSLSIQTAEKAQIILGGDITINARKEFTSDERLEWEKQFKYEKKSQTYSLFAMLRSGSESRLVNIIAFDESYPLYGKLKLSDLALGTDKAQIWVDPEIKEMFQLKLNSSLALGEVDFLFAGTIDEDPSRLFRAGGFAPRVLIPIKFLQASKLVQIGSTLNERWSYKINKSEDSAQVKFKLEKLIVDPIIQIETTMDAIQDGNRALKYFTDYLGLVALVALGLCFLCGSYLLQWVFTSKKHNIAILKTLGMNDFKILSIYTLQTVLISVFSCLLAIGFVASVLPLLQTALLNQFDLPVVLKLNWNSIFVISVIGIFGPLLMTVPQIIQIFNLHPLQLLQNTFSKNKKSRIYYVWLIASIIVFWGLSVWQSQSYKIGSGFVAGILILIVVFYFLNLVVMKILERLSTSFSWLVQYGIKGLTRRAASTSLVFITMSLSTLVLSLLPHIKASILNEIRPTEQSQIPNLFMFDIQPEQVERIQQIATKLSGKQLTFSPLVRSRILKINDQNYERFVPADSFQTREAEAEARFRNRGINLTYRSFLQASEKTVVGKFEGVFQKKNDLPGISVEEKYAERVGVKINDIITFDVQGLEIKAKVTSFRQVRWTSFQPNFFILFPDAVLEEAPKIFLTSVAQITPEVSKQFQAEVTSQFKNVSLINVTQVVQSSLKYIDQMSIGLQMMAWLAVSVGLFVFIILLNTQIKERLSEMNLMQILGCQIEQIEKMLFFQFFILISLAVSFGIVFGLVAAKLLVSFIFDLSVVYDYQYMLFLIFGLVPLSFLIIYVGLRPLKQLNPMDLIRQTN